MPRKICDFHMHSFYSDGDLLPAEIVRRTQVLGHKAIAITDHADASNICELVAALIKASEHVSKFVDDFTLIPGVELTHVQPKSIPDLAKAARRAGAKLIVVHGETQVEPVQEGTNDAACGCPDVDVLAHPGIIAEGSVLKAKENGIFLELSYRGGHCLGNGYVAKLAKKCGVPLVVNSDAHTIGDHLTPSDAMKVALGAGLTKAESERTVFENCDLLIKRLNL
jgi:putative hydrolase